MNYNMKAQEVLRFIEGENKNKRKYTIGTEDILLGLICVPETIAYTLLSSVGVIKDHLMKLMEESLVSEVKTKKSSKVIYSPKAKEILENAKVEADICHRDLIGTEHILLALLKIGDCVATRLLNTLGIDTKQLFLKTIEAARVDVSEYQKKLPQGPKEENILFEHGKDLTLWAKSGRLDPMIGREREMEQLIQTLCRRTKNNPCLVGDAGVGKTALVEGLAQLIALKRVPARLENKRIFSLNMSSVVAGSKYRGEFEDRMKKIIQGLEEDDSIILFIDELHTLIGAGASEGSLDASNIMKPALSRGLIQVIGTTTRDEYRKYIEKDGALARRFQGIDIEEPTSKESIQILEGLKEKFETYHQVQILPEAISEAVYLSKRYIHDRFLPDKAIDIMDEAATKVSLRGVQGNKGFEKLVHKLKELKQVQEEILPLGNLVDIQKNMKEINKVKEKIEGIETASIEGLSQYRKVVTKEDVAEIISSLTQIPVSKMTKSQNKHLSQLESSLKKRVIGQDEAILKVSKSIKRGRLGLQSPKKPMGSFLFLGPTGVGKTELSKVLTEVVFGEEDAMIRLDMSEYMEKHSVSKLIGSPPGYVGFDEGGQLTEKIRRKPYSLILFDEIEKAHPDVFNILLQVLDDGQMTDARGKKVDFKNTIIILTSNIGARMITENKQLGFGQALQSKEEAYDKMKKNVLQELEKAFRPEFLNRLDEIIVFKSLGTEEREKIATILLKELQERCENNLGFKLQISKEVKSLIIEKGTDAKYGARPLRRAIQTYLEDSLADFVIENEVENTKIRAKLIKDVVTYHFVK